MKRLLLFILLFAVIAGSAISQARTLEREVSRYARIVARRLDREEPLLARWEYAAIGAVDQDNKEVSELIGFVIGYLEQEIADRRMRYVAPERRDALIEEIDFSQSEEARRLEAIRRGRMLAVDVLTFVDVARVGGSVVIMASAVRVQTGETLFSESLALQEIPDPESLRVVPRTSSWAVGASMGKIASGRETVPGTGLPSYPDDDTADRASFSSGGTGPQLLLRNQVADHVAVHGTLRFNLPAPEIQTQIDQRAYYTTSTWYLPGRLDLGLRLSTDSGGLFVLGVEPSVFGGAYWLSYVEDNSGTDDLATMDDYSTPERVDSIILATGAKIGLSAELEISPNLTVRIVPAIDLVWYPVNQLIPQFAGITTWAYNATYGLIYRW
ncbi:MAG: hypothetical protein GVY29_04045 [Spirochaetes bacterium]|nr:hypothetical protein [Spirochaetota bacterium]